MEVHDYTKIEGTKKKKKKEKKPPLNTVMSKKKLPKNEVISIYYKFYVLLWNKNVIGAQGKSIPYA